MLASLSFLVVKLLSILITGKFTLQCKVNLLVKGDILVQNEG